MKKELAYVLITPYSIVKSRTGGIIGRILSRTDLDLIGIQVFTPNEDFCKEYANSLDDNDLYALSKDKAQLFKNYILENFMPTNGRPHRLMMLLFEGENAVSKIMQICGALFEGDLRDDEHSTGETVRDTYADIIWADKDKKEIKYFEPAVFVARTLDAVKITLHIFKKHTAHVPNIVNNVKYKNPEKIQKTLVIIKPDNWTYASSRPGSIIDMFSRTGLRIVGCKILRMSVAQALEFYGPGKDGLVKKLSSVFGESAAKLLEKHFDINLNNDCRDALINSFGKTYAQDQFEKIVEFMSGLKPANCAPQDLHKPGKVKSMVLIYEGENAVEKIREVLGPTDPTKAPSGTIRKEFGHNVMVNSAHASDSAENAQREMQVVKINENNVTKLIDDFYRE